MQQVSQRPWFVHGQGATHTGTLASAFSSQAIKQQCLHGITSQVLYWQCLTSTSIIQPVQHCKAYGCIRPHSCTARSREASTGLCAGFAALQAQIVALITLSIIF